MPNKFLITGASGNVGKEVIEVLRPYSDVRLRAAVATEASLEKLKNRYLDAVQMDFMDPATIRAALREVDSAMLVVPLAPNMVEMNRNFLAAAEDAALRHIVRISAYGANVANEDVRLLEWHGQMDEDLKASGIPYTILRPNVFMQNFSTSYAAAIRHADAFFLPVGEGATAYIDTRDIAAVVAEVLLHPEKYQGKTLTLTGQESLDHDKVSQLFTATLFRPIRFVNVSLAETHEQLLQHGMPQWLVTTLCQLYEAMANGTMAEVKPDVEQILGRKPIRFDSFIRDHAKHFNLESAVLSG